MTTTTPLRRLAAGTLAVLATVATLVLVPATAAHAGPGEQEFVDRLNGARAASGLPPLSVSGDLVSIAQAHSGRMAASGNLHHNPNLGSQVTSWTSLGENVGYGATVLGIHDALYRSAPHRANMLDSGFTQVGIGTAMSGNRLWVTQVFRRPTAAAAGFQVGGAIGAAYPGVAGVLGAPTSWEYPVAGGRGQGFQRGEMLWSASTGANEVHGGILARYRAVGGPWSVLGLPVTHERWTPDGRGRFNHFQRGSIYWTPFTGSAEVHGAIRARWQRLGWERSALGYPTSGERGTPDRVGRFNDFQRGSIYWTPRTGAHEVRGSIRSRWAALGWERGLGYPVSDEYAVSGGRRSDFERGSIVWDSRTRTTTVRR